MSKDNDASKVIFNVFLVLIGITVVYMMIVAHYGLKIHNNAICERYDMDDIENTNLDQDGLLILNNKSDYIIQHYEFTKEKVLLNRFCYRAEVHTQAGVRLRVLDHYNHTYGYSYLLGGNQTECLYLNTSKAYGKDNYIGLVCENCDRDNNVSMFVQLNGVDRKYIFGDRDTNTTIIIEDNPVYMDFFSFGSCRDILREITYFYFTILFIIAMGLLAVIGWNTLKEKLFEDMK